MQTGSDAAAQATHLIAVRHGETEWNVAQRLQGHTDIPLNALGQAQAQRLAEALDGETLHVIYASDLQRAHDTAAPLALRHGLAVNTDPGLRERAFGEFEGHTYAEIESRWPEGAAAWRRRDPAFEPPGGESLPAFQARSVQAALRLAARHPGQTVVLVAHGGVLDALYRAACRTGMQAPRTWELANAAVNRLLLADEGLMMIGWNDCSHLEGL
ncbi:MAG: histidine phosphatase family protein [Rubrivivax sp.]|nr:histidine phosphatase family protein [Rubrivivax sp.]